MATGKTSTYTVSAKKIDFQYDFQIQGYEKINGKGSIIISGDPEQKRIQDEVNEHISGKVADFLTSEGIQIDGVINAEINVDVTNITGLNTNIKVSSR